MKTGTAMQLAAAALLLLLAILSWRSARRMRRRLAEMSKKIDRWGGS